MTTETDQGQPCLPGGLIPLEQWTSPEVSVHKTLSVWFTDILDQLREGITPEGLAFESLDGLPALSAKKLQKYAPEPGAEPLAEALNEQLEALRQSGVHNRQVSFLVAPPFSGVAEALLTMQRRVITPPENLLMSEQDVVGWWDEQLGGDDWVLPELADFWLRHRSGLNLLKEFFARVALDNAGNGVVGCSSWCWQFWLRYLPELHVGPITLAPLTGERLTQWLHYLAAEKSGRPLTARMTHDGLYVLPAQAEDPKTKYSGFCQDLANLARGNRGVTHAIWQRTLRAKPEEETGQDDDEENPVDGPKCWVVPLHQLSLPSVPHGSGLQAGFVLHALLMHNGLTAEQLEWVTGSAARELTLTLARFIRADVILQDETTGVYRLTPLGYPSVRKYLQSKGFPVDGF
ncbi:hypothetical protein [Marinobacter sp.]|uniref:hypothetical protein n=1 Tax=Marinobacter sp. TaxID=50741 RepID=UPI003562DEC8